jgi:hypothetical protein
MGTTFAEIPKPIYEVEQDREGGYVLLKRSWGESGSVIGIYKTEEEAEAMQKLAQFSE